jgi:hypothetical protein
MTDEIKELVAGLTRSLARRYPMVEREDIQQELWCAYYCTKFFLGDWHKDPEDTEEYRQAFNRVRREIRNAAERMCRREKAARVGYQPQDEVFYSTRGLADLVTAYLAQGVQDAPPRGREESVRRPGGASDGRDYLISLVDVGEALKRLKPGQIQILTYAYGPDWAHMTDEEIANELQLKGWKGMDAERLRSRVRWALNRLQRELGGPNPWIRQHAA